MRCDSGVAIGTSFSLQLYGPSCELRLSSALVFGRSALVLRTRRYRCGTNAGAQRPEVTKGRVVSTILVMVAVTNCNINGAWMWLLQRTAP